MMKMTISADHRRVDAELAARFPNALRRRLIDAEAFRVGVPTPGDATPVLAGPMVDRLFGWNSNGGRRL
jgi:hypothetical protein